MARVTEIDGITDMEDAARSFIGDGKLPNYYWVHASTDYLTNKDHAPDRFYNYASEVYADLPENSEFYGCFDSFMDAYNCARNIGIESPKDDFDAFHSVSIEDRLSGQVYQFIWREKHDGHFKFPSITFELEEVDDTNYSREVLSVDFR